MSETAGSSTHATERDYRPDIDGLRALAVAVVIGFHAKLAGFGGGFVGVDVFFVISGYLISGIISSGLDRSTFSLTTFYARRVRRIVPALLVILLATSLMGWLFLYSRELARLGKHVLAGAGFVSNFVLVKEIGYFDLPDKPLLHLWSLAVEEQFYLAWPAIAMLIWQRGWSPRWALIAMIEMSFLANVWMVRHSMAMESFYFPVSRFWEIFAGALLFDLQAHPGRLNRWVARVPLKLNEIASVGGTALIIAAIVAFDENTLWPGFGALLPVVGTALLIAAGPRAIINRFVLSHPVVVAVGLISYPLYLWHWPLLVFGRLINEGEPPLLIRAGLVGLSVLLATATYHWLEKPIRFGRRIRGTIPVLLCLLVATGAIGAILWKDLVPPLLDASERRHLGQWGPDWDAPSGRLVDDGRSIEFFVLPGNAADTVLVLGDSHAEQYWPRIVRLRDERQSFPTVILLTYGSCPPMPEATHTGLSWERKEWRCAEIHQAAMSIARRPGVRKVVFAAFWEGYLMRQTLFLTDDPAKTIVNDSSVATDRLFAKFEAELRELRGLGKDLFVVLSNPTIPPRDGLTIRRLNWTRSRDSQAIPVDYVKSRTASVTPRLQALASSAGAIVIDPIDFLCDDSACPTTTPDGMPIFRDGHHMRSGFVRERLTFLDRVFDP